MNNVSEMEVLVMTLKHRPDRYWCMLGMFDAMEFPFDRCHTVMGKYWKDYEGVDKIVDAAIEDGFPWFERHRKNDGKPYHGGYMCGLWSVCRCLRYISQQDQPYLITEDDRKFVFDWGEIIRRLKLLPQDADTAILRDGTGESYNDYWTKGTYPKDAGATMVVYSPSGARKALSIASSEGSVSTWENIAKFCDDETSYCSSERLYNSHPPFFSLSNTPGHMDDSGFIEFKGYGAHADYDRWVDGLDVGVWDESE